MAVTPAVMGRRYAPLLAIGVVQILLVALAPSNSGVTSVATGSGSGLVPGASGSPSGVAGSAVVRGGRKSGSAAGVGGRAGGTAVSGAVGAGVSAGAGGSAAGGQTVGSGTSIPGTSSGTGGGGAGGLVPDAGCKNGRQVGPTFYMPACAASYRPDPQATMTGVTATEIKFIYYVPQGNAEVNAILNEENLAASPQQVCQAAQAFTAELNKRWELYGRKLVSLDGPGNHSGASEGGSSCHFPFFQGQCNLTPPDIPCYEAEADLIASMKPAFVIGGAFPAFETRLAQDHVLVAAGAAGSENIPQSYYTQLAPYLWDVFPSGTQTVDQLGEFYCAKLAHQPVQFAGRGAGDVIPPVGAAPARRVGIIYPSNNGDDTVKIVADELSQLLAGCGAAGTTEFQYSSDITTAQTQSETIVAGIKQDHITTVVCLCDPIAPVFLTTTLDQQGYHPEFLIPGSGLLDYDVLGQLYNKNEMRYAFGPSELTDSIPFADSDAVKAWQDAGYPGEPDKTENLAWAYFSLLGSAFQLAGPDPTVANITAGLQAAGAIGGSPTEALVAYHNPFPWTAIKDFREVWFCPTATSPINGQPGAWIPAFSGRRFQLGQVTAGDRELFPSGPCA